MPGLGLRLLTGVAGMDRTIGHVYTTDLPDPSRYLTPGDLVLTGLMGDAVQDGTASAAHLFAARIRGAQPVVESDRSRVRFTVGVSALAGGNSWPAQARGTHARRRCNCTSTRCATGSGGSRN